MNSDAAKGGCVLFVLGLIVALGCALTLTAIYGEWAALRDLLLWAGLMGGVVAAVIGAVAVSHP